MSETKVYFDLGRTYQHFHKENGKKIRKRGGVADRFQALATFTAAVVIFGGWNAAANPKESSNEPMKIVIVEDQP